jgi:hypothetical protein
LAQLEDALDGCLQFTSSAVIADLWDVERLSACEHCGAGRIARLRRLNISGRAEPRIVCTECSRE